MGTVLGEDSSAQIVGEAKRRSDKEKDHAADKKQPRESPLSPASPVSSGFRLTNKKFLYLALAGLLLYSATLFRSMLLRQNDHHTAIITTPVPPPLILPIELKLSSPSSSSSSSSITSPITSLISAIIAKKEEVQSPSPSTASTTSRKTNVSKYVNPFIGTGAEGHTFPGATVPFGMVQVSPSSGQRGWSFCSGYHWSDLKVISFGHLHLSGTGIGDGFDISLFPVNGPTPALQGALYSHENESASPGFYSVHLNSGIHVELTATNRTGVHRYTFPEKSSPTVNLHLGYGFDGSSGSSITVKNLTVVGHRSSNGWAKSHEIHFAMQFSCPFKVNMKQANTEAEFSFECKTVVIKVGLSSATIEGAEKSLTEVPDFDFDRVRREAEESWERELSRVELEGEESDKVIFYTSLYHTKLAPTLHSDLLGGYHGANGANRVADFDYYSTFSIWDTFRACHAVHTLLSADRVGDMLKSMLTHHDHAGALPVWMLFGQETNTMPGYHGVSILAESIFKGFDPGRGLDKVFESMKASAARYNHAVQYGFVPVSADSVTKTLEFAYDDWCIAEIAKNLSLPADHSEFVRRSKFWKNLLDVETGFMRAKQANGAWKTPFDPLESRPGGEYTEGTAWQHIWFVPHAVDEFVEAFGGPAKFEKKLDEFFNYHNIGFQGMVDITGLIGQYAHGNEPSHHVAYLYNYVGRPEKTQQRVRQILREHYSTRPDGLSGNEDCGQMSAWYVMSAMGFYPVSPVSTEYELGSPVFKKVVLHLPNDKTFTITAPLTNNETVLVESVLLNGKTLKRHHITHTEITNGGHLEFRMKAAKLL